MKVIKMITSSIQTNSYLLLTEKPVLIDPGEFASTVMKKIKKYIEPKKLEQIILTHFHYDHVKAAPKIKKASDAKILIHELDAKFLDFKPDKTLKGNEILDLGNYKLKIIHTPGHSKGSICLYEPRTKSLFSGDTVFTSGTGRTDFPEGSKEAMLNSLELLSKLNVNVLYPGHGKIFKGDISKKVKHFLLLLKSL